jgi:hypothetical protein
VNNRPSKTTRHKAATDPFLQMLNTKAAEARAAKDAPEHHHHFNLDPHTGYDCACGEQRPLDYRGEQPDVEHHNHVTRDIRPKGKCPACDAYWLQAGEVVERASRNGKVSAAHALGEAAAAQDPRISHLGNGYISVDPIGTEDIHALQQVDPIRTETAKPTVYIAGPMTGHLDFNYHAFHYAAADLRAAGYTVLNPAENPKPNPNPTWQDWMRVALGQLIQADAIALLHGWAGSRGARVERELGMRLELDVRPIMHWLPDEHQNFALYGPSVSSK